MFEYDVFLSFSSKDEEIVKAIWQELSQNGLRVFWSDSNLKEKVGQSWFDVIQNALMNSQHFILICTPNSMQSKWVKTEYQTYFDQCYNPNTGERRLILKVEKEFNTNLLPPFLKTIQATHSVKEIISALGGSELQRLRMELEQAKQQIKSLILENEKIIKDRNRLQEEISKEQFEKEKLKEEYHKIETGLEKAQQQTKGLLLENEKNKRYFDRRLSELSIERLEKANLNEECRRSEKDKRDTKNFTIKSQTPLSLKGVLIIYSHKNNDWLDKLLIYLERNSQFKDKVDPWDDKRILNEWGLLNITMVATDVVIILSSCELLISGYNTFKALTEILKSAEVTKTKVLNLVINNSLEIDLYLKHLQTVNSPDRPLANLKEDEQNKYFDWISNEVMRELREKQEKKGVGQYA